MSQPTVTAYFNTRKRQASDDLQGKSKVLLLERDESSSQAYISKDPKQNVSNENEIVSPKIIVRDMSAARDSSLVKKVVRNIHFDSPKTNTEKSVKTPKARVLRSRRLFADGHQVDIRESLQKMGATDVEVRRVPFEKKGSLSPKKPITPKKSSNDAAKHDTTKVVKKEEKKEDELSIYDLETPTKKILIMEKLATKNLTLNDIKNKIKRSSRLSQLKASMARFNNLDQQSKEIQDDLNKPHMQMFEKIELKIPVSPQKTARSPTKALLTPTKNKDILEAISPQKKILLEPKDTTSSPVKYSLTKKQAYQQHLALAESKTSLILPYNYRFLAEVFRCVETVSAMLFNRNELITFTKLKPAVQELLRRNFTQNHLAQIKTIFPDAYTYQQEKHRNFGSVSKNEKYELVLTPVIDANNGKNEDEEEMKFDEDNILKSALNNNMGPTILLKRRRKFYNTLLEKVKDEHEKFLLSLKTPIIIEKEKIMRWHLDFDVEACKEIEKAVLPQPPQAEKATAKDALDKVKSLLKPGSRMEIALQRMGKANMTSKSISSSSTQDSTTQTMGNNIPKVNIVDTLPTTSSTQDTYLTNALKGIPKALLEKVRARQAAKALEEMTRTPNADKEATLYSRLPELARILRNIYVAEKKGVLSMETVIQRLNNSFRTKLTPNEMDEHLRLLCKLLPTWTSIHNVRKFDYLKLDRNADIIKVIRQLEILANEKVK